MVDVEPRHWSPHWAFRAEWGGRSLVAYNNDTDCTATCVGCAECSCSEDDQWITGLAVVGIIHNGHKCQCGRAEKGKMIPFWFGTNPKRAEEVFHEKEQEWLLDGSYSS